MGTPVRDVVEAKRKEIEEALLRELARHIKDDREHFVNGYAESLAKFKMNLYKAYTWQERKVEEIDLMGFSLDEVEVEDADYRLSANDLQVVLSLPNGARYIIYAVFKPTSEMPKEEFERYTALKEEVMREAAKIAEQMKQEEERKQLEARAKELEEKVKGLEGTVKGLREKYGTLVEFIRAKGLGEEFVKYIAEKRRQEEEEEIREEFEELFEEEDEE